MNDLVKPEKVASFYQVRSVSAIGNDLVIKCVAGKHFNTSQNLFFSFY